MQSSQFTLFATSLILSFFFSAQFSFISSLPVSKNDWLQRRSNFYQSTSFNLCEKSVNLLNEHENPDSNELSSGSRVHLPFYFDFELYKTLFNKKYASAEEELARHDVFIKACIRILRNNVAKLGKNNVPENARLELSANDDKFYEEKVFRTSTTTTTTTTTTPTTTTPTPIESSTNSIVISPETSGNLSNSSSMKPEQVVDANAESFSIEFGPLIEGGVNSERPLEKAVRLVKLELDGIEEKELLKNYLVALNMDERKCLPVKKEKWPYWMETKEEEKEKKEEVKDEDKDKDKHKGGDEDEAKNT